MNDCTQDSCSASGECEHTCVVVDAGDPCCQEPACSGNPDCQMQSLLPDTGVLTFYNNSVSIDCPAAGEPFYGQDAQYVAHPMSYTASSDVITDNVTGLMWQAMDDGISRTWVDALTYCANKGQRLPTFHELLSISDFGRMLPALDPIFGVSNILGTYWTSTPGAGGEGKAWKCGVGGGLCGTQATSYSYLSRCVQDSSPSVPGWYQDNGDGTVTDLNTGLMWQQIVEDTNWSWQAALLYCQVLELGGHDDWRLPDIRELASIVDVETTPPLINLSAFGYLSGLYWTSTTRFPNGDPVAPNAYCGNFNTGGFTGCSKVLGQAMLARCVR
jgi:hypothetical protein